MRFLFYGLLLVLLLSACQPAGPVDLTALAGKARAGDSQACRQLVDLLAMQENSVNEKVYAIVVEIGQPMVEHLLAGIESENRGQREYIIAALGTLQVKTAIQPISQVLLNKQLKRRYIAAWALGEIGDPVAIPTLLLGLGDPVELVRQYATRALIKFNRDAVDPLLALLPQADPVTAAGAIRALGDIGDKRSIEALLGQVAGTNRQEAYLALGKLRDPRAEAALIQGLTDADWQVRMNAAMALGPIGSIRAIPALQGTLEDETLVVREWSARSLSVITGTKVNYRDSSGEMVEPYSVYH